MLDDQVSDQMPPAEELIELCGAECRDDDWLEILPPDPTRNPGAARQDVVCDFRAEAMRADAGRSGLYLATYTAAPFALEMVQRHGVVFTPVHVMRADIAEIFIGFLPPPFWIITYWRAAFS